MKFSSSGLIGSTLFLLACASSPVNAQSGVSSVAIEEPANGSYYFGNDILAYVPGVTTNTYVGISGGAANAQIQGVSWDMVLEFTNLASGVTDIIAEDKANNQNITLDGNGKWEHDAGGVGVKKLTGGDYLPEDAFTAYATSLISGPGIASQITAANKFYVIIWS